MTLNPHLLDLIVGNLHDAAIDHRNHCNHHHHQSNHQSRSSSHEPHLLDLIMGNLHDGAVDHRDLDVGLRVTKSRAGAAVDRWIFFVLQEVLRKR